MSGESALSPASVPSKSGALPARGGRGEGALLCVAVAAAALAAAAR